MTSASGAFSAEPRPSAARVAAVAARLPENPFATAAYAAAREAMHDMCWLLSCGADEPRRECFGFLRSGRVNRVLEIASLPDDADALFYDGLLRFCRDQRVTVLELNTFASAATAIPRMPREQARRERAEWLLDLTRDWRSGISTNHRRNIARAARSAATVRHGTDSAMLDAHCALLRAGAVRREGDASDEASTAFRRIIDSLVRARAGRFFQLVRDDGVLASAFILDAERGGYYHSAGSSTEGREAGAAHLLVDAIADTLRDDRRRILNLGDAGSANPGLMRFKAGFGARAVPSTAVRARPFSLRRNLMAAAVFFTQRVWAAVR